MDEIKRSARVLAARRALAYEAEDPVGADCYGHLFRNEETKAFVEKGSMERHFVILRFQLIEDFFTKALSEGTTQFLMLGAGFDTKFQRHFAKNLTFVEVDTPAMVDYKKEVLEKAVLPLPKFEPLWIESIKPLNGILKRHFDPKLPVFVSAEGLFYYLKRELYEAILSLIADTFESGIQMGFDLLRPGFLEAPERRDQIERLKSGGEELQFEVSDSETSALAGSLGFDCEFWTRKLLMKRYYGEPYEGTDRVYCVLLSK